MVAHLLGKEVEQDRYLHRAPRPTSPTAEAIRSDRIKSEFESPVGHQFRVCTPTGRGDALRLRLVGVRVTPDTPHKPVWPKGKGYLLKTGRCAGSNPATGTMTHEPDGTAPGLHPGKTAFDS